MSIRKLSPLIANQIAAGEVVERPSSVVKELLENAIDAGADRIQIDIERGGTRLIRVSDNGHGISKQELQLALARHATSKVEHSEDLKAIHTLGFRGEALASISSVARLTLSSRPEQQEMGWSAIAEGLDMEVSMQPQSLPVGTIVEVRDLFFNTPARQKFLRAERTEYIHVEDTVKRIALASPQIALTIKHNSKVTKRIPAANNFEQQKQRVASILGNTFIAKALFLELKVEQMELTGWLSPIDLHQNSSLSQFVFVNGRAVKDRMLNHAIRQSYQGLLPEGRMASYILYLNLEAEKVDVNVHPTKHEVRFSESRMVHDFIEKAVRERLLQQEELIDYQQSSVTNMSVNESSSSALNDEGNNELSQFAETASVLQEQSSVTTVVGQQTVNDLDEVNELSLAAPKQPFVSQQQLRQTNYHKISKGNSDSKFGVVLAQRLYLQTFEQKTLVLDLQSFCVQLVADYLQQQWQQEEIKQKPLLIPIRLGIPTEQLDELVLQLWNKLGFDLSQVGPQSLLVRKIPTCVEHIDLQAWLQNFIYQGLNQSMADDLQWQQLILDSLMDYWHPQSKTNWAEFLQPHNWQQAKSCRSFDNQQLQALLLAKD